MTACSQEQTVAINLKKIQNALSKNNAATSTHYELTYNVDFPCQVSIQESSGIEETLWLKRYQFDLTDIAKNSFIQSKTGRRAINYTSEKHTGDANKKQFKPVKINNFSLQKDISEKDQKVIISELNKAIALCEEEYSLDE